MLKKIFISENLGSNDNLYFSNIIISDIDKNKKLMFLIFLKNSTYFFNLKSNIC